MHLEILEDEYRIQARGEELFAKSWSSRKSNSLFPIVLFHDSLGCVALWRDFPSLLARTTERRVIAYDRFGFGRSSRRTGPIEKGFIELEAELNIPLLSRDLGFEGFVACGHSVGGGMAVEAAARMPQACKAAVAISAQAFVEDRTLEGIRRARQEFMSAEAMSRLRKYHGEKADWVLSAWVDTWLSEDFAGWNLDRSMQRLKCPLLAIHGESDEYGSLAHPRRFEKHGADVVLLQNTGHVPHRECPVTLAEAVGNWLKRQRLCSASRY